METRELWRAFLLAAYDGDLNTLQRLAKDLDRHQGERTWETVKDVKDRTALHFASYSGNCNVCKYLITELKFNINAVDERGNTPLHEAILGSESSDHQTTRYLLKNGADVTKRNNKGYSPLHYAAERGSRKLVQLLLVNGAAACINLLGQSGAPLRCAAALGKKEAVELLLQNGADANQISLQHFSPLLLSINAGSLECTELLLKAGANPNVGLRDRTPLSIAARDEKKGVIEILLKFGANPNVRDGSGRTALEYAALASDFQGVRLLFPKTKCFLPTRDWSIIGLMQHVRSDKDKPERQMKNNEEFQSAITKGEEAVNRKDYNDAVYWYTKAIGIKSTDPALFYKRSLCWYHLGVGDRALSDAVTCIEYKPCWSMAHYSAGAAWKLLEDYPKAALEFMSALVYEPDNDEIRNALRELQRNCSSSKVMLLYGTELDREGIAQEALCAFLGGLDEM